ncbi:MAG: SDR family NAD(P)-dependent oxidoreductase [Luteitalea sp.]|nr:SDR family NAD(P)-dependent oxidoreductase [Luteitalea sp.]
MTGSVSRPSVLVTGASRGLGLETALALAARGFRVWAGLRDVGATPLVVGAARARRVELRSVPLDVTDPDSIDAAVRHMVSDGHGVDAVVNNAGITAAGYFEDLTDDDMRRVFEVNLFGAMNVTRRVLPLMRAAGRGRVVMMSSVCGRLGSLAVTPYVASKFAIEGWSESLAMEVAPFGIRVVIIEPGLIATDLFGRNRGVVPRARDARSPYYERFLRAERQVDALVRASRITPADVACAVCRALTATRPRLRYIVGRRARLLLTLQRHLPGELFETLYGRVVARRMAEKPVMAARTKGIPWELG